MNVGELRKMIESLPDETPVLSPAFDHSFTPTRAEVTNVLLEAGGGWTEDYGEAMTPEAEYGKRHRAVVVS